MAVSCILLSAQAAIARGQGKEIWRMACQGYSSHVAIGDAGDVTVKTEAENRLVILESLSEHDAAKEYPSRKFIDGALLKAAEANRKSYYNVPVKITVLVGPNATLGFVDGKSPYSGAALEAKVSELLSGDGDVIYTATSLGDFQGGLISMKFSGNYYDIFIDTHRLPGAKLAEGGSHLMWCMGSYLADSWRDD